MTTPLLERLPDAAGVEQAELLEAVGDFARRELAPRALELDTGDAQAFERAWDGVCALGLDGALAGEGGEALAEPLFLAALEQLAHAEAGVALAVLLHNAALALLPAEAEVAEGERWALVPLPPAAARRSPAALAVTRNARPGIALEGSLGCALGTHGADGLALLVPCSATSALALPVPADGLVLRRDQAQMGLRAAAAADIELAGVQVDAPALEPGAGASTVEGRRLARAGVAAIARGISRRAYELALEYARSRRQGGVAIVEHGAVRELLAAMAVRLRLDVQWDRSTPSAAALAAKVAASDAAVATTTDAVQVFGGTGYMHGTGVEKLMRDAKYCQLYPEPNWLAREELFAGDSD